MRPSLFLPPAPRPVPLVVRGFFPMMRSDGEFENGAIAGKRHQQPIEGQEDQPTCLYPSTSAF